MKRAFVVLVLLLSVGAFTAGCNTVEGMGRDIEKTGEAIQDAF